MKAIFEKLTGVFVCDNDVTKVIELTPHYMGVSLLKPREIEVDPELLPGPEFERTPAITRQGQTANYVVDPGQGPGLIWFLYFNGQDVNNQLQNGVWTGPAGTLVLFSQVVLNGKTAEEEVTVLTVAAPVVPVVVEPPLLTGDAVETGTLTLYVGRASDEAEPSITWYNGVQPFENEDGAEYLALAGRAGQVISAEVEWTTSSGGSAKARSNYVTVRAATTVQLTTSGAVVVPIRIDIMAVELSDSGAVLLKT